MAKLPDPALAERPTPRAEAVGLSQYRGSFGAESMPDEALAKLGGEIANIGDALGRIDQQLAKSRQSSQLTDAIQKATYDLGELELAFQRDPDWKTAPQRFDEKVGELQKKYIEGIDDGLVKKAFAAKYQSLANVKRLNVRTFSAKHEGEYNVSMLDDALTTFATAAANAVNPAERSLVINEARLAIEGLKQGNWITAVDAGNRERAFLAKVDETTLIRDMALNPIETAHRIAADSEYVANLDPAARERWIDRGVMLAEKERNRVDREAEKLRKARGDELMKDGLDLAAAGKLTMEFVTSAKPFVSPTEYASLLKAMDGAERRDDTTAFADLQRLVDDNPDEAQRKAFQYHKNGLIRNETLASVVGKARSISRQEGPKTEYERSRQYITNSLDPGPFSSDPAPKARYGLAVREYEDYAATAKRTDVELREKADEVVRRFALIDMNDLARRTGLGAQPDPDQQLEAIRLKAEQLMKDRDEKKITQQQFNRRSAELDRTRKAAEKAKAVHGK